jgi:hypothetical protein
MATKFTATRNSVQANNDFDAAMAHWNSGIKASREEAVRAMVVYLINAVAVWEKNGMNGRSREALALNYFMDPERGLRIDAEQINVDGVLFSINAW